VTTVEQVLIIILAIGFFTLLVLSIILVSILIAIMRNVKRISDRAEEATSNLADVAAMVGRKLAPFALSGVAAAAMRWFKGRHKRGE
jgi:cell division protein FtsL